MFGISYDVWKEICEMYFSISQGSLKAYLQWFPYTKISDDDKELIKSREFFDKYIDSGGFVLFPEVMRHSENFIQKGDGSFRNSALISPLLFLVLQSIGKEISTLISKSLNACSYKVTFDASKLSSGIYFYRLTSGNFNSVKKMILIK